MLYCDPCRVERRWPWTVFKKAGVCSLCNSDTKCHRSRLEFMHYTKGKKVLKAEDLHWGASNVGAAPVRKRLSNRGNTGSSRNI